MLKLLLSSIILFICLACSNIYADLASDSHLALDKTHLVSQQVDLLKIRIKQAKLELTILQKQQDGGIASDRINKQLLNQASLSIAVARSNLDSINIELTECQQTVGRLEKEMQEIQNQLNVFNIFGLKIARDGSPDVEHLRRVLKHLTTLLQLEKDRENYLIELQGYADSMLQFYKNKAMKIDSLLKSQTILSLKEQQAKSELGFEQQQGIWIKRLNDLEVQVNHLEESHQQDTAAYSVLHNEIFYVNENISFTYLQLVIARYQEQLQQLKISITRASSITLLNKVNDQVQALNKQLLRIDQLLKTRIDILTKRKTYFIQGAIPAATQAEFATLDDQYKTALDQVAELNRKLVGFRTMLDQALQQELSSRQGLPGFGAKAWLDLGGELLVIPSLAFHVFKSLGMALWNAWEQSTLGEWILILMLEVFWLSFVAFACDFLKNIVAKIPDHEFGHINLKWLGVKLLHRNLWDIAMMGNFFWVLLFLDIPMQNFMILIDAAAVWLVFKTLLMTTRLGLVETVHDREGHDVRLYHQLKWIIGLGGVITMASVFVHQLPVVYEVKDLFDRFFLLFLLIASVFLLTKWDMLPKFILPHLDNQQPYLKRIVRLLGLLIPLILFINAVIGLFGYVNLVLTISWYENIFILVLVAYLLIRGFLNDGMELISKILIRHVTNGWLWTEAFLKPLDRVLKIMLFLMAWAVLFLLYGWDQQSPVVERLNKLLHYQLISMLNTTITPLSVIELAVIISLLYWAARWTREFVYRLLLSRTKDLGLRNSMAILSQYAMIVIGVFIGLRLLGIDFRALAFVATAFAFGVGLGLRDLVNNFACGFLLLLERPVRVGDIVTISEYEGEIVHIGGRAVTVRTWDHTDVLIPNAEIFSKSFTNWTAKDYVVRSVFNFKINQQDSPQDVQAIIYQVLDKNKNVLKDPVPEVLLKEMLDGFIEIEVRYYLNIRQVKSRIGLRSEVLLAVWEAFEQQGIHTPYPHQEIYLKK